MARKRDTRSKAPRRPGNASEINMEQRALQIRFEALRAKKKPLGLWSLHILNCKVGEGYLHTGKLEDGKDQMLRFMTWAEANDLLDTAEVFVQ